MDKLKEKWEKDNLEGKILLEKTKLQYTKEILNRINNNPSILEELLDNLEITEEDFKNRLLSQETNIAFYDQAYTILKQKNH